MARLRPSARKRPFAAILASLALMGIAACEAAPLEQILQGKACDPSGQCAAGYVCDSATNVCVTHLGGAGGASTSASSSTGVSSCISVTDCPLPDNHCEAPICVGGLCGTTVVAMGIPSGLDAPNDCKNSICNGAGKAVTINDDSDLPLSVVCEMTTCDNGAPLSRPARAGTGCSDNGGALCNGSSQCVQCLGEADCTSLPPDDECQQRVCSASGVCMQSFTPNHTPVAAQDQGDCMVRVCNGAGAVVSEPLVSDAPNDGNDCTTQTCNADGTVHLVNIGSGIGCSAGVCDGLGHCTGCVSASDCGSDTFCAAWNCNNGTCQQVFTASPTALPAAQQTAGDCQTRECNGNGGIVTVVANQDVPADDGVQCTVETCANGSPQHPAAPFDQSCNQGGTVCDGSGSCVECNSPSECPNQGGICSHATCSSHSCGLADTPNNTPAPLASQTAGDCLLLVCNGSGQAIPQADDDDLPVDGDDCTFDQCSMGVPSNPDTPNGSPCGTDGFCDGGGHCSAKKPLGGPCAGDAECDSGHCPTTDGVCCNDACNGTCEACTSARSGVMTGMCTPIPAGQDPDSECMQLGQSCNGSGACAFLCGQSPTSTATMCPAECTGGCAAGVCFIDCNGAGACNGAALACPAGFACTVDCDDLGACDSATITCPNAYACSVICSNGACGSTALTCNTGTCSLQCADAGSCSGATATCGQNTCSATCTNGAVSPAVACGSACGCTSCP